MVKKFSSTYPGRMLLGTLISVIVTAAWFLTTPWCSTTPVSFLDMLFVSTSMTCVTGLSPIPLDQFTTLGQVVLLGLIQLGGLGIMTMTLTILSLFINMGLTTQLLAGHLLEIDNLRQIKKMFAFTFLCTAFIECIGMIGFIPVFLQEHTFMRALFYAAFHSVSCFCNAGVSLPSMAMTNFTLNGWMLTLSGLLMLMGSFGFICWYEVYKVMQSKLITPRKRQRFSLNTKIVIYATVLIVAIGTVIVYLLEAQNTLSHLPATYQWLNAFFNAISMRSTGALSIPIQHVQLATILTIMVISFIGSAPGSTGSGIKVTVFTLFLATVRAVLLGKKHVDIFNRSLTILQVYKAIAIVTLSLGCVIFTCFFLLITEKNGGFLDIFFESLSALVNLGVSTGVTPLLTALGKIFIMITMLFGRIGSLTLALAFVKNRESQEFSYPEEKIMLS